jgi:hypothetical protein
MRATCAHRAGHCSQIDTVRSRAIAAIDENGVPGSTRTSTGPLANAALSRIEIGDGTRAGLNCTWPVTLDRDYASWANQHALAQLGKAGFRLAALLRAVFSNR